jgi:hypothetical protein
MLISNLHTARNELTRATNKPSQANLFTHFVNKTSRAARYLKSQTSRAGVQPESFFEQELWPD